MRSICVVTSVTNSCLLQFSFPCHRHRCARCYCLLRETEPTYERTIKKGVEVEVWDQVPFLRFDHVFYSPPLSLIVVLHP